MPTQSIQVGVPTVITQNIAYAMPARSCYVNALAAIEVSVDGSAWVAQTAVTNSSPVITQPFVRCTTASTTIVCRPT
jgi:uncharacterized membrane protein YfbV (UPF0208 family)